MAGEALNLSEVADAPAVPERLLAIAVLWRAMVDAGILGADNVSISGSTRASSVAAVRAEALAFLLGGAQWREAREIWCGAAGLDPAWLARRISALAPMRAEDRRGEVLCVQPRRSLMSARERSWARKMAEAGAGYSAIRRGLALRCGREITQRHLRRILGEIG